MLFPNKKNRGKNNPTNAANCSFQLLRMHNHLINLMQRELIADPFHNKINAIKLNNKEEKL